MEYYGTNKHERAMVTLVRPKALQHLPLSCHLGFSCFSRALPVPYRSFGPAEPADPAAAHLPLFLTLLWGPPQHLTLFTSLARRESRHGDQNRAKPNRRNRLHNKTWILLLTEKRRVLGYLEGAAFRDILWIIHCSFLGT